MQQNLKSMVNFYRLFYFVFFQQKFVSHYIKKLLKITIYNQEDTLNLSDLNNKNEHSNNDYNHHHDFNYYNHRRDYSHHHKFD